MLSSEATILMEAKYPVLRPCPFCNGVSTPNSCGGLLWIECDECGARGKRFRIVDWEDAVHYWTHRCELKRMTLEQKVNALIEEYEAMTPDEFVEHFQAVLAKSTNKMESENENNC